MELVASVSKIMKHPRKIPLTRSTKTKSFCNKKNATVKSNRFHRFNSLRNSTKLSRNKSHDEVNNFINNNGTEIKSVSRNFKSNSLQLSKHKKDEDVNHFINNNGSEDEPLEKPILGEFTRYVIYVKNILTNIKYTEFLF